MNVLAAIYAKWPGRFVSINKADDDTLSFVLADPENDSPPTEQDVATAVSEYVEPRVVTYAAFRAMFTESELAAIRVAVLADAEALDWALDAAADNSINLASAVTSAFLDKMIAAGIIDTDRKAEIVA